MFDLEKEGWEVGQTTVFEKSEYAKTECKDVEYSGGEMTEDLSALSLDAEYDCYFSGADAEIEMGSCRYAFSDFETAGGLYEAAAAIECGEEGDAIEIDILEGLCVVEIPAQSLSDPAPLANPSFGYEGRLATAVVADDLDSRSAASPKVLSVASSAWKRPPAKTA